MRSLLAALTLTAVLASVAAAAPFTVVNNGAVAYRIDGVDNPTLNLVRGTTYTFNVTSPGHPFYIKTAQITGTGSQYTTGVTNNGTTSGAITWVVDNSAPALLYYNCSIHSGMTGEVHITNAVPGLTPVTGGVMLLLLAAAGAMFMRRRSLAARA